MTSMEKCAICHEDPRSSISLIKLGEKSREDNLEIQAGQHVHECRRVYTNPHEIQKAQREKKIKCTAETPKLRSQSHLFNFRTHCFICGQAVKGKETEVYPIRTNDLQTNILKVCQERNDDWAVAVRGRIETINDLHAADAIYHQTCSVNFRTSKAVPKAFFRTQRKMKTEVNPKMTSKRTILKARRLFTLT